MAVSCCELKWLRYVLHDLQVPRHTPTSLYCDNECALYIASNPMFHEHTKNIEVDYHFVHDEFLHNYVAPAHIPTFVYSLPTFSLILWAILDFISFLASWAFEILMLHLGGLEGREGGGGGV